MGILPASAMLPENFTDCRVLVADVGGTPTDAELPSLVEHEKKNIGKNHTLGSFTS